MDSLISVIIPVYNVRHYLEACINSVLCQTYKRLEIILVDDGSTDGSQDICDNYASTYDMIEVIHQKNGGQSRARNAGLASANGEYISFIDSDDILHEQYYEIMLYMLDKFEADVAQCAFERFASEKELGKSVLDVDNIGAYRKQTARDAQRACFGEDSLMYSSASNKLYKRSAIGNNVFPEGRIYEDTYFVNKIYDGIRNMIVTEHKLYYYRYVADSTLHRKLTTKNFDICTLYEEFAKKYSDDEELLVLSRLHYKKCIEIMYIDAPIALGVVTPIIITINMDDIIENNTPIAVVTIVNEDKSTDFSSFTLTMFSPRTSLWIFQAVHR